MRGFKFRGVVGGVAAGEAVEFEHGHHDVFEGGEFIEEEMELKDESNDGVANGREAGVGHLGDGVVVDEDFAMGGAIEAAEEVGRVDLPGLRHRRWRRIRRGGCRGRGL